MIADHYVGPFTGLEDNAFNYDNFLIQKNMLVPGDDDSIADLATFLHRLQVARVIKITQTPTKPTHDSIKA